MQNVLHFANCQYFLFGILSITIANSLGYKVLHAIAQRISLLPHAMLLEFKKDVINSVCSILSLVKITNLKINKAILP